MAFLSIFNSEKGNKRYFNYKESVLEFDLEKISFFFATTESDKIFAPLRDRLTIIDFDNYTTEELKQIFINNLPDVKFDNDALEKLAVTSRGNARNCVLRAKEVNIYCSRYNIQHFTIQDANNICHILDILPLGLNKIEMSILKILRREGRCTLNMLAAKTGLSRTSIQKDHESYLLKMHLISIDGLRSITNHGCRLVDSFK
jgi:Holliday junction resolvasome RuvABC ATP-dependent DNA helicase subunit